MDTHAAQSVQHGGAGDGTARRAVPAGLCLSRNTGRECKGQFALKEQLQPWQSVEGQTTLLAEKHTFMDLHVWRSR